jgi:hypothetical protein
VWESARFTSIFLASSFSYSQALSTPAHTQVTQTVGWQRQNHNNKLQANMDTSRLNITFWILVFYLLFMALKTIRFLMLGGPSNRNQRPKNTIEAFVEEILWYGKFPFRLFLKFVEFSINGLIFAIVLLIALLASALLVLLILILTPIYVLADLLYFIVMSQHVKFPLYDSLKTNLCDIWRKWIDESLSFVDFNIKWN